MIIHTHTRSLTLISYSTSFWTVLLFNWLQRYLRYFDLRIQLVCACSFIIVSVSHCVGFGVYTILYCYAELFHEINLGTLIKLRILDYCWRVTKSWADYNLIVSCTFSRQRSLDFSMWISYKVVKVWILTNC